MNKRCHWLANCVCSLSAVKTHLPPPFDNCDIPAIKGWYRYFLWTLHPRQWHRYLPSQRKMCNRRLFVCLSLCLLATLRKSFRTDLREIFREGWQWANEQMIKFWWRPGSRIRIRIRFRNTGKTWLGGGMHCPSASSSWWNWPYIVTLRKLGLYIGWSDVTVICGHNTISMLWGNTRHTVWRRPWWKSMMTVSCGSDWVNSFADVKTIRSPTIQLGFRWLLSICGWSGREAGDTWPWPGRGWGGARQCRD